MYAIIKLGCETPVSDGFVFWDNFKRRIKSVFRLISPLIKSSVVLDSMHWNIKWE